MKDKIVKILNIVVDVLVVVVLIVSVLVATLALTSKSQGVPNLFGYAPFTVLSNSMSDTFEKGDLIISKVTNDPGLKYEKGDVVTFPIEIDGATAYNTHRIVEVIEDESIVYYKTQGDNKDTNPIADEDLQTASTIVAKHTGTVIPGVGNFIAYLRTQMGFFLCVLLPMIIFFIYQAIRVVINIVAYNKEKAVAQAQAVVEGAELTEEQKQKAIAEYLASIGQEVNGQEPVQTPADSNNDTEQ
jgi:signal peptidase